VKRLALALLLPLFIRGQSITGKTIDPALFALKGVSVRLLPVGGDWVTRSIQTDSNGRFRFFPVDPGEYVIVARHSGFRSRVRVVHVFGETEVDIGVLELGIGSCDYPGIICDSFLKRPPPRPPVPVVDLCEALKSPDRYGNQLIVVVGMPATLDGWPTLTATCDSALASGGLIWPNAVLLPENATRQQSLKPTNVRDLKKKLADRAASIRKTGSERPRVVAVYGYLDAVDGLTVVPCTGSCVTRADIQMLPATFLRVDGFQELK
jgi:hypothetical protein